MFGDGEGLGMMMMMTTSTSTSTRVAPQPQWSQQETKDFIRIRAEVENINTTKRTKTTTLWELVSAQMRDAGYTRTPDQCKCKWKNLLNRYKGKETSDPENGRQCPFFDELHAVFTERAKNMHRLLLQSEPAPAPHLYLNLLPNQTKGHDEEERPAAKTNSRKRIKPERIAFDKSSTPIIGNAPITTSSAVQELLKEFFQQQLRMEMQWREMTERRAQERLLFEEEWRQAMVKREKERLMAEQTWQEREEQRRMREEARAERRDALLTTLLTKLIHDDENNPLS
uniref:Myb-like domain-containing protein n=1 Tax=Fagus sylvatica TaxID=28930 RepID=A0A2N9HEH6_FAGSY